MHDHPFATLVTPAASEPFLSHVPLLLQPVYGTHDTLIGHVARANPHWKAFAGAESIAVFHGPHAYVSPSWYAEPSTMVPTWNYATAHTLGAIEVVDDPLESRRILEALVHRFEAHRDAPWQLAMPGPRVDALIGAIVAFRMRVRRLDAKFKLSQNRTREDRSRVMAALEADEPPDAAPTARWMRAHADPDAT